MKSTILVIDDEPLNLEVISNILKNEQLYNIYYAPSAKIGLEIVKKQSVDAIIMDWDMPDMNGIEATRRFKENESTKDIPIIIATGKAANPNDLTIALGAGATDFLRKPIVQTELMARHTSSLQISRSYRVIKQQNDAMKTSLGYAQEIQESMLPKSEDLDDYFKNHFVLEMIKEGVKGDLFWLRSNLEGNVMLVLIDAGPSVGGALISTMINLQLQRLIDQQGFLQAHEILNDIYRHLHKDLGLEERNEVKVMVCIFNKQEESIQFAGAQTTLFLVKGDQDLMEFVGEAKQGANDDSPNRTPIKSYKFKYEKGDKLYLFTDGFECQPGGENFDVFGSERMKQLIKSISTLKLEEQRERIEEEFHKWLGISDNRQNDDFVAVGIEM